MDSLDVDLLNSLNVSTFSDLRPLPMLISYGTIRQFWPRNVTSAFQKCGFCRSKEIFSGPNPRGHLDFFSFTHTAIVSNFPPRHIWQPIAEHRPASGHQGPRSMAPTTSLTSSLLPLLPPHCTFLTVPHTWQSHICLRVCALAVLISPLPLGLCSNIISIEKPTSTVPFKDCPPNPGAFYSFFFKAPNTTTQINF